MRRTGGRVATAAMVGLFLSSLGAAVIGALPFEATLGPTADLGLGGAVEALADTRSGAVAEWTPRLDDATLSLGPNAYTLSVFEIRWSTTADGRILEGRPIGGSQPVAFIVTSSQAVLRAPRIDVVDVLPSAHWVLATDETRDARLRFPEGSTCDVSVSEAQAISLADATVPYATRVWRGGSEPIIRGTCAASSLEARGPHALNVYGTHLRVSPSGFPGTTDVRRDIETGVFSSPRADGVARDVRLVYASLSTSDPDALTVAGPVRGVRIQAPQARVAGALALPASEGDVSWGTSRFADPTHPLEPKGTFTVSPASKARIAIHGEASSPWRAVAVGVGIAGAAAAVIRYGSVGLQFLFTRLTLADALQHPRRRQIVDVITANPGIRTLQLARILGTSERSVRYHAAVLVRQGLLLRRSFGRSTAYFLRGQVPRAEERRACRVQAPALQQVVESLDASRGMPQREVVARTGLSQSRVSRILSELRNLGVVSRVRDGRRILYRVGPPLPDA